MKTFLRIVVVFTFTLLILLSSLHALTDRDLAQIQNAIQSQGARWQAGDNPIFRMDRDELERMCGAILECSPAPADQPPALAVPPSKFPAQWDWRNVDGVNYITPIRNQAGCGSCVAHGTIAAFEGLLNIYCGTLGGDLDLSEQHIFSCGGGDCDYGWSPDLSCQYLLDFGAPPEWCLPYSAVDDNCDQTCPEVEEVARKIMEWDQVPLQNPQWTVEQIKTRLLFGPVLSCFDVYEDFSAYVGGVYQYVWGEYLAGHCIAIVGWDDDTNCWICKNSWGPGWGENGYFRIRMGTNETTIEEWVHWMIPLGGTTAFVEIDALQTSDTAGNGDGVPDPGETLDLTVTLKNQPTWGTLTGITGWLLCDDPRATVQYAMTMFPDSLPGGGTVTNSEDPFAITLAEALEIAPLSFTLWVNGTRQDGLPYTRELFLQIPVILPQTGWPVATTAGVRCSPLLLWHRGGPRRLAAVDDAGTLHLWGADGTEATGFPFETPGGEVWGSIAAADLDGDGREEILFGSQNDTLYAVDRNGAAFFKRDLGADIMATPAVADLEEDGGPEIVLATRDGQLCVLDAQGRDKGGFPVLLGGPVMADAALADLDDDGCLDVVVGATDGKLYAVCGRTGQNLPGFPFSTGGAITSSPVVADLNVDGILDIVFGSDDGSLYAVSADGATLFVRPTGASIRSSPAIADLDGNGALDIIFTSQNHQVYAVRNTGQLLYGWPYNVGKVLWSSPIVVDIDDDGALEVILEVPGMELIHLEADGTLQLSQPIESEGIAMSSPVAGDLDNDGDLEIAVGTVEGVSVWNYPTPSTVAMPWPMYRGNPWRTGCLDDNVTDRAIEPSVSDLPAGYTLEQNYPNPFNPQTTIRYRLAEAGPVYLAVYNILGQKVVALVDGYRAAGQHAAVWSGLDASERAVSPGIYFYRLQAGQFDQVKKLVLLR
jgi:hypothetical protein